VLGQFWHRGASDSRLTPWRTSPPGKTPSSASAEIKTPPDIRERVLSADAERLLDWSERILTAETLESVLH
jgi:hypothetical protein